MTFRVLALDAGLNFGWGAVGGGRDTAAGSRRLPGGARDMGVMMRAADGAVREFIMAQRPNMIVFAAPFIAKRVKPENIRPLFGILAKIEEVAAELRIRCAELDEPECRRAFLTKVPRFSADIKIAVRAGCALRGWPAHDHHAADALCVASRAYEIFAPEDAHATTPLFVALSKVQPPEKTRAAPRRRKAVRG